MRIWNDAIAETLFLSVLGFVLIISAITNWGPVVDAYSRFKSYSEKTRRLIYAGIGLLLQIPFVIDVLEFIFPNW